MSRGIHAKHRYKPVKGLKLKNGQVCVCVTTSEMTGTQLRELARKKDRSVGSFAGELIEFALMELEEQGELVLNKFKHREIIESSHDTIKLLDNLLVKK